MSKLKYANKAFNNENYELALDYYDKALNENHNLKDILKVNVELCKRRMYKKNNPLLLKPIKKLPITALVITWDIGHNPLGRSYMLAEALEKAVRNVVLCGFQFERYGNDVWEPVRNGKLPVVTLPGGDMKDWLFNCEKAIEKFKPDIVIACKARLPSVELGILFKEKYSIPLIVDIDDHELSFFNDQKPLSIECIEKIQRSEIAKETHPYSGLWTRLADSLARQYADKIITSNVALDREFGGTLIPHVRDEKEFDPSKFNKVKQRLEYSINPDAKVVMFFGTPRAHKGIGEIAKAIGEIENSNFLLVLVGSSPDRNTTDKINELAQGKAILLPNQPFSAIPSIVCMADLIVLPQDLNSTISKFQLPAKAIDAIGMGIPLLVSPTEPLMQLVKDGVAKEIKDKNLKKLIEEELNSSSQTSSLPDTREKFLLNYSYHSAATKLKALIESSLKENKKPLTEFHKLKKLQKSVFNPQSLQNLSKGKNIVLFWKQNDTGLYGRRSDMVVKYLASREDVRKVIVIDAPLSLFNMDKLKQSELLTQGRKVYIKTYEKLLGVLDSTKVSYNVFLHPPGIYTLDMHDNSDKVPLFNGYSEYLQDLFEREKINAQECFFWFYPKIPLAESLIEYFKPEKVIVDIVDDHRCWPNVSQEEKKKLTRHYCNILSKADVAFANCHAVIDSMKEFKSDIQLIPNGCEEIPLIIEPKNNLLYEELKDFDGKVIGFVGNLEAKIDINLIEKISEEFKDAIIVLVGSTHSNPQTRELQKYPNIRMFGVIPHENINAIVSKFDVGIVPHIKMGMTNSMNPLKVFTYLANKIPVVATEIDNLPSVPEVKIAANHADFIYKLSVELGKKGNNQYQFKCVKDFSWSARFSKAIDKIMSVDKFYGSSLWGVMKAAENNEFIKFSQKCSNFDYEQLHDLIFSQSLKPDSINNSVVAKEVFSYIKNQVVNKKPFSLVRLNDGEGCLFFDAAFNNEYPILNEYILRRISNIIFGKEDIVFGNKEHFFDLLRNSFFSADIVGIPERGFVKNRLINESADKVDVRAVLGSYAQVKWIAGLENTHRKKIFTSPWVSRLLLPYYGEIFKLFSNICIITGNEGLGKKIEKYFSIQNHVIEINVPTQGVLKNNDHYENHHYPTIFEDICLEKIPKLPADTLVLIGAGLLGKAYAHKAKELGYSSIDIGHVADIWAGENSRPGFSQEKDKQWAL